MGCGSSTESSSNGHGAVRAAGDDEDGGFIPPPAPAAYEEPDPKPKPPKRYISRVDDDEEEDLNPNAPAEVTNKAHELRTEHMGRVTSTLDTRSSAAARSNRATSRPSVRTGDLWRDKFTDVALRGADVSGRIEWKRPSVGTSLKFSGYFSL